MFYNYIMYSNKILNNKPAIFYKYLTSEAGLNVLNNGTIRFSNPICFNDPYDSNMPFIIKNSKELTNKDFLKLINLLKKRSDLKEFLPINFDIIKAEEIIKEANNYKINPYEHLNRILAPMKDKMRVLSLSSKNDNLLMWGHYCHNHEGIVIGFNCNCFTFKNIVKVPYSEKIPEITGKLLEDFELETNEALDELHKILQTKSKDWSYEEEWRCTIDVEKSYEFFKHLSINQKVSTQFLNELKRQENYIHYPFPLNSVQSIYLGVNINIIDEFRIINLKKFKYPQAKIFKAYLSKDCFKIIFKEINLY